MIGNYTLSRKKTGLMVIDVQERLFNFIERPCEILEVMHKVVTGFQILNLPILVTEQYPQGLGSTILALKNCLRDQDKILTKTTFSCLGDETLRKQILDMPIEQWVLVGIEAHVCVLQTAKDLLANGKQVAVLNDAISSRSIYDFSTAIAEMRDIGVRVTSAETVLFELVHDSKAAEFKEISNLVK
jgi:nicotinamidase-related amidase